MQNVFTKTTSGIMIMKPMVYGEFNDCFSPILDGVSETVRNYAYWLNRHETTTYVVTPSFPGYVDREDFPVLRYFSTPLPMRAPYRLGFPLFDNHIFQNLRKIPFQLVHTHSPFSAGSLAVNLSRKQGIPVIATFHSKYKNDFEQLIPNKAIIKQLIKNIVKFYESVDEVWIPQRAVEETIRDYGYKGHVEVVDNGIDFQLTDGIEKYRSESRKKLGVGNKKVLLFVGQHIWEKNLKFLIESLSLLRNENYVTYFIGEGYAKQEMIRMVKQLGLEEKVKFLGQVYDRHELQQIYASANLFLFPSLYDNAPLVVREAAMMHTPALLLEGSTASEVIKNNFNGFLSENNVHKYAERINEITANPQLQETVGSMAASTICRPWENIVEEVNDRYQELIRRKRLMTL
jgi:glycosyltransferase involved in cell wall biosynthesis